MTTTINKIAIITTRQNYKWTSMQEVLPAIEQCWINTAKKSDIEVQLYNIDEAPLRTFIHFLFQCDAIIIIAFNETVSRFMREVRAQIGLPIPFVFHLYGHATIGMWPEMRFGVLPLMHSGDAFIGTCPGDLSCMKITGENFQVFDIPYPFFPLNIAVEEKDIRFAYVGRLSDQKNIDVLIRAYHRLFLENKIIPDFYIYGDEDHFGSPNMGIKSTECQKNLRSLVHDLNLSDKIVFKGFKSRDEIYNELGSRHIFLSASTHSDENFGMALMRSLSVGAHAVVTHWGGHISFKKHMPAKVQTVQVGFSHFRPLPEIEEFTKQMRVALDQTLEHKPDQGFSDYFKNPSIEKSFQSVLHSIFPAGEKILLSETAQKMYEQQVEFEKNGDIQRVFNSYDDPKAQLFLRAYAKD